MAPGPPLPPPDLSPPVSPALEAMERARLAFEGNPPAPWQPADSLRRCRGRTCTAEILELGTRAGKTMPVDPEPNEAGNVILLFRDGPLAPPTVKVLSPDEMGDPAYEGQRYMPHFATCRDVKQFRGKKPARKRKDRQAEMYARERDAQLLAEARARNEKAIAEMRGYGCVCPLPPIKSGKHDPDCPLGRREATLL